MHAVAGHQIGGADRLGADHELHAVVVLAGQGHPGAALDGGAQVGLEQRLDRPRRRQDRLGHAGVVPQLEAAGVQVGGARHRRPRGRGIDDPVLDALARELAGQRQTDRAGAGHDDGDVRAASHGQEEP